ncbi:MFS transporter, ACS family, pantothenate transporter [Geosmithia morbida]|uniref:MFS transporter, ACS family, pantothenate transporter n=1 Tax=Geosmithia morbida TaxID=1094350 RepID=A0A9P4YSC4_9HYPO|nr:MFS transporter, ACS family, pantothenate transporter [Geosmithia morbida]KAF4122226.1 MFS transporter, ACS family, pantothenate transporter [Geosmithia morbida]
MTDNKRVAEDTVEVGSEYQGNERPNRIFGDKQFFSWFNPNDGPLERRLITKLDFFILAYAFIGFWVLYIDRGILSNAYVSGMREDLQLFENQLVQLGSIFSVGYCVQNLIIYVIRSMVPATLLVTRYPAQYVIPTCMCLWGIFTLLCFQAHSFSELAGYRFVIGLFQGPYFCSIHYVLGSWYRADELVRRAGIFYISSGLGTMTTSVLAARIFQSLDGALGHAGWRWMYVVGFVMTIPVAVWGFVSFPGTPRDGKRWFFTDEEFSLARERMRQEGRLESKGINLSLVSVKRFLGRWHFWVLVPWNVMWLLGYMSMTSGGPLLWLKSNEQYSTPQVNNYSAIYPSLGILFIWSISWTVDKGGQDAIVPIIGGVCLVHFVAKFAWILYDETSFSFKWFAIAISYIEVSLSPINYSVANIACAADAEERAFIISSMLAIGTAFNCWVPLLAFPTVQAPRFFRGYITEAVLQVTYVCWTIGVIWMAKRDEKRKGESESVPENSNSA